MSWPARNSDTGEKNHFPSCRGEKGRKRSGEEVQLQTLQRCQKLRTVWSEKASSQNLSGAKWTSDRSDLKKKGKRQRPAHFQMSRRGHASASHGSRRSSRCMCDPPGPLQLRCGSEVQEWGVGEKEETSDQTADGAIRPFRSEGKTWGKLCEGVSDRRAGPSSQIAAFLKAVLRTFITSCSRHGRTRWPERFQSLNSGQAGNWDCGRSSIWTGCKYTLVLYWWEKRKYIFF